MEQITLKVTPRSLLGKKVKILRGKGQIPAVIYGRHYEPRSILLDRKEFLDTYKEAGEATLINLAIEKQEPLKVLIRDIQKDPVSEEIIHVDLYKVDMMQKIQTEIPLEFIGAAPAVEELEGNLITNKDSIKVECLPDKLVSKIDVDISALKTFEDLIHVNNLHVPDGIEVLDEPEDVIAQVTPPRSEEELETMEEEAKGAAEAEKEHIEGIEAEAEKEKAAKETEAATEKGPEQPQKQPQEPGKNEQK